MNLISENIKESRITLVVRQSHLAENYLFRFVWIKLPKIIGQKTGFRPIRQPPKIRAGGSSGGSR